MIEVASIVAASAFSSAGGNGAVVGRNHEPRWLGLPGRGRYCRPEDASSSDSRLGFLIIYHLAYSLTAGNTEDEQAAGKCGAHQNGETRRE